jgi:hypothetical protein
VFSTINRNQPRGDYLDPNIRHDASERPGSLVLQRLRLPVGDVAQFVSDLGHRAKSDRVPRDVNIAAFYAFLDQPVG